MRTTVLVVSLAALSMLGACAGMNTSRFRTADGEPAPTYTRMDSVWKPAAVACGGDVFYLVDTPNEGQTGMRLRKSAPRETLGLTAEMFCGRVRDADERERTASRE